MKIKIYKEEDRITVAAILVKNGYTVRQGKERKEKGRAYEYCIETLEPDMLCNPSATEDKEK